MEYKIGQILYTCNEKKMNIIPLQVVELVTRTTREGSKKEYIVILPDQEKTEAPLSSIKGDVFKDINDIKNHLLKNAENSINKMIDVALNISKEVFKIEDENIINQKENDVQADSNNDIIMVDLGNGVKAKMNTSNLKKVAQ